MLLFMPSNPDETLSIYRRAWVCPGLPSFALPWGAFKAILLSRAHVSIRHQAARPPAGVSDPLQTLAGSHNIACKLHAITEDFQSSREAPKPHFPTFATLPSENLDFHQKKATFTCAPVVVLHLGSLLPGVSQNHGNPRKSPLRAF